MKSRGRPMKSRGRPMKIKAKAFLAMSEDGRYFFVGWGDPKKRRKDGYQEDAGDMKSQAVEFLYNSYSDEEGFDQCHIFEVEVEVEVPTTKKIEGKIISHEKVEDEDE